MSVKANVSNVALVSVKRRKPTVGYELAGDTDLTSKYCTFIDWLLSHHCGRSGIMSNSIFPKWYMAIY